MSFIAQDDFTDIKKAEGDLIANSVISNESVIAFHLSSLVLKHLGLPEVKELYKDEKTFNKSKWDYFFSVFIPGNLFFLGVCVFFFIGVIVSTLSLQNFLSDYGNINGVIKWLLSLLISAVGVGVVCLLVIIFKWGYVESESVKTSRVGSYNYPYYKFLKDLKIDITKDLNVQKDKIVYLMIWVKEILMGGSVVGGVKHKVLSEALLSLDRAMLRNANGGGSEAFSQIEYDNEVVLCLINVVAKLSDYLKDEMGVGGRYHLVVKDILDEYRKKSKVVGVDENQSQIVEKDKRDWVVESNDYLMSLIREDKQ